MQDAIIRRPLIDRIERLPSGLQDLSLLACIKPRVRKRIPLCVIPLFYRDALAFLVRKLRERVNNHACDAFVIDVYRPIAGGIRICK